MPVRGVIGTDYLKVRPDFRVLRNPYGDDDLVVVPAIVPDVAVFHAFRADREGNAVFWTDQDNWLLAQAARRVIVTVEDIVDGELSLAPNEGIISWIHIDAVVRIPLGASPTGCPGRYRTDSSQVETYIKAAADAETFRRYVEESILAAPEDRYQEAVRAAREEVAK